MASPMIPMYAIPSPSTSCFKILLYIYVCVCISISKWAASQPGCSCNLHECPAASALFPSFPGLKIGDCQI